MNPWHEILGPLSAEDEEEAVDKEPDKDQKDGGGTKDPRVRTGKVSPPA